MSTFDEFEFQDRVKESKAEKASKVVEAPEPEPEETTYEVGDGPKYDEAELDAIFDSIMFEGKYTEEVVIGKNRLKAVLSTRSGKDAREVMVILDKLGLRMGITVESLRSVYNLAQSVVVLNGKDLSAEPLEAKIDRIERLPTPVISALMTQLIKFDLKVEEAVRHGEENF